MLSTHNIRSANMLSLQIRHSFTGVLVQHILKGWKEINHYASCIRFIYLFIYKSSIYICYETNAQISIHWIPMGPFYRSFYLIITIKECRSQFTGLRLLLELVTCTKTTAFWSCWKEQLPAPSFICNLLGTRGNILPIAQYMHARSSLSLPRCQLACLQGSGWANLQKTLRGSDVD